MVNKLEKSMWQPIETYPLPINEFDYDVPQALFYSPESGIQIAQCIRTDFYGDEDEPVTHQFNYSSEGWEIKPTHWMPLPDKPGEGSNDV